MFPFRYYKFKFVMSEKQYLLGVSKWDQLVLSRPEPGKSKLSEWDQRSLVNVFFFFFFFFVKHVNFH